MSWTMGSIDCLALKINNAYIKALKKDVEEYQTNPNMLKEMSEEKRKQFEWLLDSLEAEDLEDVDTFYDNYCDYMRLYDSDNYAQARKIDVESGKLLEGSYDFDGYVIELSWGSESIYQAEFNSKEDLKKTIEEAFYLPKTFDWENNIIFLTGVWAG